MNLHKTTIEISMLNQLLLLHNRYEYLAINQQFKKGQLTASFMMSSSIYLLRVVVLIN